MENSKYLLAFTIQLDEAQNDDSLNGQSQELNPAIWVLATFSVYLISSPSFPLNIKEHSHFSIYTYLFSQVELELGVTPISNTKSWFLENRGTSKCGTFQVHIITNFQAASIVSRPLWPAPGLFGLELLQLSKDMVIL